MKKTKAEIIAEIGINHNGSVKTAYKLIKKAKMCGADYIKLQFFTPENLALKNCPLVNYQKSNKYINQYQMLKKYALRIEEIEKIKKFCKNLNIKFLISVFSKDDFIMACKKLSLKEIKIPSGEMENYELLHALNPKNIKIYLSTGMSNLDMICKSLNIILKKNVYSYQKKKIKIKNKKYLNKIKKNIVLMHCISNYPVRDQDSNILALKDLSKFELKLGYSDHTNNYASAIASYMLGAKVFEKHFTLNNNMIGPDHSASMTSEHFKNYVDQIKIMEKILKLKNKRILQNEKKISKYVKKSLVAKKTIKKGEVFTFDNLTTKRPALGVSSSKYLTFIGRKAKKDYFSDDII